MKLTIEQRFTLPVDVVARAYADPLVYRSFPERGAMARPVLIDRAEEGGQIVFRVQHRFVGQVSAAVHRVVDPTKLTWVEHVTLEVASATAAFRIQPDHYRRLLRCEGTYAFVADGDGCRRTGSGELRVRAPLVAGAVEGTIVAGLQAHLREEVPLVESFLNSSR